MKGQLASASPWKRQELGKVEMETNLEAKAQKQQQPYMRRAFGSLRNLKYEEEGDQKLIQEGKAGNRLFAKPDEEIVFPFLLHQVWEKINKLHYTPTLLPSTQHVGSPWCHSMYAIQDVWGRMSASDRKMHSHSMFLLQSAISETYVAGHHCQGQQQG